MLPLGKGKQAQGNVDLFVISFRQIDLPSVKAAASSIWLEIYDLKKTSQKLALLSVVHW